MPLNSDYTSLKIYGSLLLSQITIKMTKSFSLTVMLLFGFSVMIGQTKAITETGETVVLYGDGTWEYESGDLPAVSEIPINDKKFTKEKSQTFQIKSTKTNAGLWIDGNEWIFTKGEAEEDAEYNFQMKGEDLYGMMISEKLEIPLDLLRTVALENARAVAPDIRITEEEYRTVNGIQVLAMQMSGTIQGLRFTYYGYYYSNSGGTVQLLTYTGSSLFNEYKVNMEKFLNGFVQL
jgi:hypothetical protein